MYINQDSITDNTDDIMEKNKKDVEYYSYIVNHRAKVKEALEMYFLPLLEENFILESVSTEELKDAIRTARDFLVDKHDDSKFSDSEFDPYRAKWYPTVKEKEGDQKYQDKMLDEYEAAWKHHLDNNPHHPCHWVNKETGEIKDMELPYIVEMICDWESVSMVTGGNTVDWYTNKAEEEKLTFSTKTREIVDDIFFNLVHK